MGAVHGLRALEKAHTENVQNLGFGEKVCCVSTETSRPAQKTVGR